ncbi:hypothetical protein FBU30_011139 [Linnemannia zychae]|nr:hypothetical protein FBU30_011139 [Linnemannia zychae]
MLNYNSPLSSASSCSSSPFSSTENAAELDLLDMQMFFPSEPSIYQQILDIDDVLGQQQQQQLQLAKQQQFQYEMARIGLGTPPTSPPAPAYHSYNNVPTEIGTMYYEQQGQVIHNVYVTPTPVSLVQPSQHTASLPHKPDTKLEQELAYLELMQQFDNIESSLFSQSPINSSCSSSLSNSPYAESPLSAISADFDLFPLNTISGPQRQQQASMTYPTVPIMAPMTAATQYNQHSVYHQMTPPTSQMDLEREACSLFRQDTSMSQPMTADMSQLCKCPGKFPCGEPINTQDIVTSPIPSPMPQTSSPLQSISEDDFSESDSGSEEDQDWDPIYVPSHTRSAAGTAVASTAASGPRSRSVKARPKSLVISSSISSAPYSKDAAQTPVRQDRRRSSSGSYSSGNGGQQLMDPEMLPKITDIHVCPVCSRRFSRPFNLRSHIMTHTTARPYSCDECHWSFTRQHDLLRHKRAKHPNSVASTTGNLKNETSPKSGV